MKQSPCRAITIAALLWAVVLGASAGVNPPGSIVIWGDTSFNLASVPGGLVTNATAIACGLYHDVVLKNDGTLVAWGAGTNNTGSAPSYGQAFIPAGLPAVAAIAAGSYFTLVLYSNGTVAAWGDNSLKQTNIPPGLANVTAIAAGDFHSLALKSDGTVTAWGHNVYFQTNVPPGLSGVAAVAGGQYHSLALRSNGTVIGWGDNTHNQTNIPTGLSNVIAIAAGDYHNLALTSNGTVTAWGYNISSQTNVPAGLSNVVAIAAAGNQSLALTQSGTVVAWGSLTSAAPGLASAAAIAAGGNHAMAITEIPLLLSNLPPMISLAAGATTNLNISIWSGGATSNQWFLNGTPIAGANTTSLAVSNFAFAKSGAYSITVSNTYGSVSATSILRLSNSPVVLVDGIDVGGGTILRTNSSLITITNTGTGSLIYYTLDGSTPDFTANPYSSAFALSNTATLRVISYNSAFTDSQFAVPINLQIIPVYSLTATTPGGGSVVASPAPYASTNRYLSNTVVTLTATPSNGWSFLGWTGGSTATTNVITLPVNSSLSVQAIFGTTLNLLTIGSGQVILNPTNAPYPYGTPVQLTAIPSTGNYFFGWANTVSGFSNPLSITATNGNGITALFAALKSNQVSLTLMSGSNGTVTPSPNTNYFTNGQTVTLTAFPATNYVFTGWSGAASGTLNPLTIALNGSEQITASFAPGSATNLPVITQSPLSRTLGFGSSTVLGFQATNASPYTYQWLFNGTSLSGAIGSSLTLTNFTAAQAGLYKVVVTGTTGSVTSAPASVALFNMLMIPSETQSYPLLVLNGASGTGYLLQYSSNLSLTNWTLLGPVTLQGNVLYYVDTAISNIPRRFYRAVPQ